MNLKNKKQFCFNVYFTIFTIKKSSAKKKCGRISTALLKETLIK